MGVTSGQYYDSSGMIQDLVITVDAVVAEDMVTEVVVLAEIEVAKVDSTKMKSLYLPLLRETRKIHQIVQTPNF